MATITEVKQKIIDKIDKLLDGLKEVTSGEDVTRTMELIDRLITAHDKLGGVYDDADVIEDEDSDPDAE
jgi:hypothetical protein